NRLLRSYHHGVSDDLYAVVRHVISACAPQTLALVGFSLGGNVIMKYLGEKIFPIPKELRCGVGISVPCDLEGCAERLAEKRNAFYQRYFFRLLRRKVQAKMALFPGQIDDRAYDTIRNFREHDDLYTAPLHGFKNALDYWHTAACGRYLEEIRVPALIINAADDPFLSERSYPKAQASTNEHLFLEIPHHGGHCGFVTFNGTGEYWVERRSASFLEMYEPT
ncbi:MAG: alpha/beta fold hydrolase, partial [Chitinivibrionales bacterium]|nr:alpha/beta fold hydrolase [Chitinivibrionales bacterium]MBD3358894.1 alpha/beta fold hydrolase [Chitinivibrionales bacterium]